MKGGETQAGPLSLPLASPISHLSPHLPALAQDWGILGTFLGVFPPPTHLTQFGTDEQWSED